jgi:cobalt-precorrin 5A hydrolase
VIRAAGIGLNARATREAVAEVLDRIGPCDRLATLKDRSRRLSVLAGGRTEIFAAISPAALRGIATPTQSPRILALHHTGSVAEACALIAAGRNARIVTPRISSRCGSVTAAVAEGEGP